MSAGQLRERITLQAPVNDEYGEALGGWDNGFTVWARVQPLKGGEPVLNARLQGVQPMAVTVRASPETQALTSAYRMVWEAATYAIKSPPVSDERGAYISFLAELDGSNG